MGLSNSPSTFQRVVTNLFADMRGFVKVYLDDVIIHSASEEEHL